MRQVILLILGFLLFCNQKSKQDLFLISHLTSTPRIHYYFTDPYDLPNNIKVRDKILEIIEGTQVELYLFVYEINEKEILQAILKKYQQGVKIYIFGSNDQKYSEFNEWKIPYKTNAGSGLQHIKMILSDKKVLFSGTGNFTQSDIFYNSNLFIEIPINEMTGNLLIKKFYEFDYLSPITIQGPSYKVKILKSPENGDSIQSIMNNTILRSKRKIDFFVFSFFDPTIMNSLYYKSQQGVLVSGIIDQQSLTNNENIRLLISHQQGNSFFVYQDNFHMQYIDEEGIRRGAKIHHKTLLVDNLILTGSYNLSLNAKDNNHEVFFVIEDPKGFLEVQKKYQTLYEKSLPIFLNEKKPSINDIEITDNICQKSSGSSVYFQNKNAFLFMIHIKDSECPTTYSSYSSGIVGNPSDGFPFLEGVSIKNFQEIKQTYKENLWGCSFECDFCEIFDCSLFKIQSINLNGKYFTSKELIEPIESSFLWDGQRWFALKVKNIIKFNHYYYLFDILEGKKQFSGKISDGIIFLKSKNNLFIGCFYKNNLRKNLRTFLNLLEWYQEKFLALEKECALQKH
ncbi:MAG: phospholipase D-like domain-containing protein [Leptospiraceae bacterium]|nr:phospholipase D-like domain-containing protein [Leptospiraceae bacterium]MDW7975861.1 phospholipase D-like domain-containing protein [Leptospiraceae bacterium]